MERAGIYVAGLPPIIVEGSQDATVDVLRQGRFQRFDLALEDGHVWVNPAHVTAVVKAREQSGEERARMSIVRANGLPGAG